MIQIQFMLVLVLVLVHLHPDPHTVPTGLDPDHYPNVVVFQYEPLLKLYTLIMFE